MPNCNHDNGPGRLVASFSWRSSGFAHGTVPVEHAVDNVTLALVALHTTAVSFPHSINDPYSFIYHNFLHYQSQLHKYIINFRLNSRFLE